jgi:alpha-ribazole phosphatase
MKTLKIHLIRHGVTDANYKGQYIGCKTDLPLSPEGLNELRMMKDDIDYPEIKRLYSSPLLRAKQSGAVLYPDVPMFLVDDLKEYDFGDFEGKTANELELDPDFKDWASGKVSTARNGEDNTDFIKRLCVALHDIVVDMLNNEIESAGVIMHGGAIMMLLAACAVPQRRSIEWNCEAGQGYSLLVTPSLYHKSGIVEVYGII